MSITTYDRQYAAEKLNLQADNCGNHAKEWEGVDRFVSQRYYAAAAQLRRAARHVESSDDS